MNKAVRRIVLGAAVLAAAAGSGNAVAAKKAKKPEAPPVPEGPAETGRLAGIVAAHNAVRAAVPGANLPPLTWDPGLAADAQKWADAEVKQCKFENDQNLPNDIGENSSYQEKKASPQDVIDQWTAEKDAFKNEPITQKNYAKAAHYAQLVWRATTSVGCGMAIYDSHCPQLFQYGGYAEAWVCRYRPAGNVLTQKPY